MVVNGTMEVKVDIKPEEALKVIKNYLGLSEIGDYTDIKVLDENSKYNTCGKKAIYKVVDMSWYGSYKDEYNLITCDEDKIAIFEAYLLLESSIKNNKKLL